MAKMIPPNFDESTTSHAERTLWYQLANHLDDDWTVIHALPWLDDSRPRLQEGECDFLLLHPRHGFLVLEAKSGAPRYDGRRREWRYDDGRAIADPFDQARVGMHHLHDLLQKKPAWREAGLPYGYAVAFPDARAVQGDLHPQVSQGILILEPDLDRLQTAVIAVLRRFGEQLDAPNDAAIDAALTVLAPVFRLVPTLVPTIASVRRDLVRLTGNQADTLDSMADNRRLLVRGGAGTGKTLLIVAEARRRAAEGERVLVLCFNRPLGKFLAEGFADCNGLVTAATFHNFCAAILSESGAPHPPISAEGYWDTVLPEAALDALSAYPTRYDTILVDEAQDFRAEWWLLVEEMLADPRQSRLHVFCDELQDLYGRDAGLPFTEPVCILKRNCRNTAPIARFARGAVGLVDDKELARLPDGPEPVLHRVASREEQVRSAKQTLHNLVHEQGISPDDIVVLGCHKLENSAFASRRVLGNLTLRHADDQPAPNTVRYATVHKFKGLEADCVLLTGIGEPSQHYGQEHWRTFQYIGGSRARVVLHVFRWEENLVGS